MKNRVNKFIVEHQTEVAVTLAVVATTITLISIRMIIQNSVVSADIATSDTGTSLILIHLKNGKLISLAKRPLEK